MPSGREAVMGFGRQSAAGSALSVPKFEIPMGGGFAGPVRNIEELPWTNDSQDSIGDYVNLLAGEFSFSDLPVLPRSSPALIQMILGLLATTGGSAPYTQTGTPADDLSPYTVFYQAPGDGWWKLVDAIANSWQLKWGNGKPLMLDVAGFSKSAERLAAKWGAAGLVEAVDPFFTYINATMKLEAIVTPAVAQVHNIGSGSISVGRNVDARQTDGIGYQYLTPQKRDVGVELNDVVLENNDFINAVITGSTSGTAPSANVVYGSLIFTFLNSQGAAEIDSSLKLTLPRVLWRVSIPESNPSGDTVTLTYSGKGSKPSGGSSITAVVKNSDSGSNY